MTPGRLSVQLGTYELHRESDRRFRGGGFSVRYVPGLGWGFRVGSNPHCWWLVGESTGGKGRVWVDGKIVATLSAPNGPQGEHVTLTLAKDPGPFEVILAEVPAEIVQAIEMGWARGYPR